MTITELTLLFNTKYGLNRWPSEYVVDLQTYVNVVQYMFDNAADVCDTKLWNGKREINFVRIGIGPHNGIMLKNVELLPLKT